MGLTEALRQQDAQVAQAEVVRQEGLVIKKQRELVELEIAVSREIEGASFNQEQNSLLSKLLDCLNEYGYKEYLNSLGGRAGSRSSVLFTTTMPGYHPSSYMDYAAGELRARGDNRLEECRESSTASKLDLDKRINEIGLFPVSSWSSLDYNHERSAIEHGEFPSPFSPLFRDRFMDANTQFFGDLKVVKVGFWSSIFADNGTRFTEPREVGIGFRFAKLVDRTEKTIWRERSSLNGTYISPYMVITERYSAFYVRIKNPHHAVVTGAAIQEVVDLSDLKAFDEVLERAYIQPFSPAFTVTGDEYRIPTPSEYSS